MKRELNEKKAESEALRARSQDMMRLKFGRVVDLENFESGAVNTRAEELKVREDYERNESKGWE